MRKTQYFCDRCKAEVPTHVWGRRIFRTTIRWWSLHSEVCLCDKCTESLDIWLAGGYSLRELFEKKPK